MADHSESPRRRIADVPVASDEPVDDSAEIAADDEVAGDDVEATDDTADDAAAVVTE